jgi:tripartite-type tricarboxylate transporter receptor subunit TctC
MSYVMRALTFCFAVFCAVSEPVVGAEVADGDTEYFRRKTITYIVGTEAGGTYDTYARLIGRYMEDHLPETTIVVRNVPGAGNIIAANLLYATRPDGLTIGTFNTGLLYAQLFRLEGVRFDLAAFEWIGKAASDPLVLLLGHSSPMSSLDELMRSGGEPALLGTSGIGSSAQTGTALMSSLLNLNVRTITGYSGQEVRFSIIRGDVHGMLGSLSALSALADQGYGKMVLRVGGDDVAEIAALPEIGSLVTGEDAAGVVNVMRQTAELGRFTVAPAGVPPERLQALRRAYQKALENPRLLADAKRLQLPIVPAYGDDVARRVREILDLPEATLRLLRKNAGCAPEAERCVPQAR